MSTKREKELKKEIRDLKREMKDRGIRVISCLNGGHSAISYSCNAKLFQLKIELDREQGKI